MNTQTTQNPINNTNPNFLTGLGHGFLSLFSLGDVYDVNGDLNKASSDASQNIQNTINKMSLACFKSENEANKQLWTYIQQHDDSINETINYYNLLSNNNIFEQNLFIKILAVLIFVIIFFMLIK